ncbi:hypothetical protein DSM106972_026060 [Dulcicalothrix desertica PCC 7102]|uniref:Uncharacterized protein n=1 Tax=Dulcicalothrix desertica PCC 7102 TaxID=232991 RepID=A0A3S1DCF3_9CYAN|nr:beta-propeller fold lactonase family protein [Dulcicalothrix desertica]RUT07345.1 hypothetical protein DSM106972_026060 [Dulcicalothrix desertica PCC 7102]
MALSVVGLTTSGQTRSSNEEYKFGSIDFAGRYIAALSDGDYTSTDINGKLPRTSERATDKLSIIPLPLDGLKKPAAQINVSNTAKTSTSPLATSPDGKTVFIVETLGQAKGALNVKQIPSVNKLTAIDLSDLGLPKVTDTIQLGQNPKSVSVNPNGDLLAIPTQIGQKITFVPVQNNQFGVPKSWTIGIQADCKAGSEITHIEWHPNGRYIAAVMQARNQVVFYKVQRNHADIKLVAWGKPVEVGSKPFSGKFTPNGRFFITNNAQVLSTQKQPKGTLSVIQLAKEKNISSNAKHQIVSTAVADSPKGMAISADSDLVATVNKLVSSYPENTKGFSQNFSISLFKLDSQTGHLSKVAEQSAQGILSKGIEFDAAGDHLAIAVSDYFKPKKTGAIEIWRVARSPKFGLERTNQIIDVGKGTHAVVVW